MDVYTYAATSLLSFFGIVIGAIFSHYTKDEVHSIKQFFPFIQFALLLLMFVILYFFFPFYVVTVIFILAMAFIYFFWNKISFNVIDYTIIAIIFVLSSLNMVAHLLITIVAFLFGIITGALFYVMHTKHKKYKKRHVFRHKHSGLHMKMGDLSALLFHTYKFFFILSLVAFAVAQVLDLMISF